VRDTHIVNPGADDLKIASEKLDAYEITVQVVISLTILLTIGNSGYPIQYGQVNFIAFLMGDTH